MPRRTSTVGGDPPPEWNELRERFDQLAPAFLALASRTAVRRGFQIADADDIAQTALTEAVAGLPDFHGQTAAQLWRWFSTILHNRIVSFVRSDRRHRRVEGVPLEAADTGIAASNDPDDLSKELANRLRAAIDRLPARQRVAVRSFFYGGKNLAAIARKLGISADAARMVKSRGLIRLQAILRGGGDLLTSRRKVRDRRMKGRASSSNK